MKQINSTAFHKKWFLFFGYEIGIIEREKELIGYRLIVRKISNLSSDDFLCSID